MGLLIRTAIVFLILSAATAVLINYSDMEFGTTDYWEVHGVWFLIFISCFPRLTLLFSSVASGGILWWLGWLFAPRLLVSFLATLAYWNTNPVLVLISWLITVGGETSEKHYMRKQVVVVTHRRS